MDRLLLHIFHFQGVELLIKHLAEVHGHLRETRHNFNFNVNALTHTLSWIFCHRCARKIWINDILRVGIFPCMKMPVRSNWTWKPA